MLAEREDRRRTGRFAACGRRSRPRRSRATAGSSDVAIAVGRKSRISAPLTATAYSPSATSEAITPTRIWSTRALRNSDTLPSQARAAEAHRLGEQACARPGAGRSRASRRSRAPPPRRGARRPGDDRRVDRESDGGERRQQRGRVEPPAAGRDRRRLPQPSAADQEVVVDERGGHDAGQQDRELRPARSRPARRRGGREPPTTAPPTTSDVDEREREQVREERRTGARPLRGEHARRLAEAELGDARRHEGGDGDEGDAPAAGGAEDSREQQGGDEEAGGADDARGEEEHRSRATETGADGWSR